MTIRTLDQHIEPTEGIGRTLLERTLERWDNSSMIVTAAPNASDGILEFLRST